MGELSCDAAVTAADHQNVLHIRMHGHRHMDDHFIIDKLVLFGEDDAAVGNEKAPELRGIKDVDALKIALSAVKLFLAADGRLDIVCMHFGKPEFHFCSSFVIGILLFSRFLQQPCTVFLGKKAGRADFCKQRLRGILAARIG